jgi:hypothetical protein
MEVQDVHHVEAAADRLIEVMAQIDLATLSVTECQELWKLCDELEGLVRRVSAVATAALHDTTTPEDDDGDRLSHPLRRVET